MFGNVLIHLVVTLTLDRPLQTVYSIDYISTACYLRFNNSTIALLVATVTDVHL